MRRGPLIILASLAIAVILIWSVVLGAVGPGDDPSAAAGASPSGTTGVPSVTPTAVAPAAVTPAAVTPPGPTRSPEPSPHRTAAPTVTSPLASTAPSDDSTSTEDPQVSYVRFLARLAEDRSTVADLNQRLVDAAQDDDRATVRTTALDILRFTDGERDWLAAHPPADCYVAAHAAADAMVEAYATVAERAIDWADAEGLAAFEALTKLLAAGDDARDALAQLATAVERTTCPG